MNKKYYFIISLVFISFLSSCALQVKDKNLFDDFNNYSNKLKIDNDYTDKELENLFNHFSPRYQTEILNGRSRSTKVVKHLITNYLNISLQLKNTLSHYETHAQNKSCLLINAKTNKNERVSLYITYVNQQNSLIDNLNVEYLGENQDYLKTPICDVDALMKKRMENWK